MNVLFLSVSTGGGHMKAAEAIEEAVKEKLQGCMTLVIDTLKYVNPLIDRLVVGSYLNAVKRTPRIYGKLYEISESGESIYGFSKNVTKLMSFRLKTLIDEFMPSIIVCTHPFPLQMISCLKAKGIITIPVVAVITDFAAHTFWVHEHVDAYITANEYFIYPLVKKGVPKETIYPFGIPVSKKFLFRKKKDEVMAELGLESKPTIMIMGGSLGFGELHDVFLSLINFSKDVQVIAVTGKNTSLKRQLEEYSVKTSKKVIILSYTNLVSELMDACDFIITKPGGMTVAEALIKELPILIISPIPGQEEENAHFLVTNGVAARIPESNEADNVLLQIINNPVRIRHMKEMARYLARPNASEDIVCLMERLVENRNPAISTLSSPQHTG